MVTCRPRTVDGEDPARSQRLDWMPGAEFVAGGNKRYRIVGIQEELNPWWVDPVEPDSSVRASEHLACGIAICYKRLVK